MTRTVLISGVGIAGPTLAFWLSAAGFKPTLVERAPALRTGGYVVDFWGVGYDIAEDMGLVSEINRLGYHTQEMRIVDGSGTRLAGFGTRVFDELTAGRYVTLARSELSRLLYEKTKSESEVIFGDEIVEFQEEPDGVQVRLKHGGHRRFDLLVGADGLHSAVRRLAFGPQYLFEKRLGYTVAAFESRGYRPRDEDVYVMYGQPGQMLGRFALRDDRTLFLFVFADEGDPVPTTLDQQHAALHKRYGHGNWESSRILGKLDNANDLYFDSVSQIRMKSWSRGRVVLVGDAAFCVSLLAGQGSALAMISAYFLAAELSRARDHYESAFAKYEGALRNYIGGKQRGAERFAAAFAPKTSWGLWLRNQVVRTFAIPGIAKRVVGRQLADNLALPEALQQSKGRHATAD
jgi:2-polyprenyl-6-methoxyphenol hydroxylase-like FAD-dependent oxidoreductase